MLKKILKLKPLTIAFLAFLSIMSISIIFIFWGTWGVDRTFIQPDSTIYTHPNWAGNAIKDWLCGGMWVPSELLKLIGSHFVWLEFQYAFAGLMAACGMAYYLKGRGFSPVAYFGGGAAYGLCGYSFSLFSAGHLGWFVWLTYGPFMFGLIDRVIRKGSLINWILLGAVIAWSGARQPDMWLLFMVLAFFYGVWCFFREHGGIVRTKPLPFISNVLICIGIMLAIGWPQFSHAIFHDLASREQQIKDTSSISASSSQKEKDNARWEFVTGWSMPPEDTLEFIAPCVRGASSDPRVNGASPYWGRLGRVVDEKFVPGRMNPNYRQHSLYLGAITAALALLALFAFWGKQKDESIEEKQKYSDIPFWTFCALLFFICSLGRFTPFYKLVYALPFGDFLRAPVKFHHLVEFCVAALAGHTIEYLLSGTFSKRFAYGAYTILAIGAGLLIFAIANDSNSLANEIYKLGYNLPTAKSSATSFSIACVRGAILFGATALIALRLIKSSSQKERLIILSILAFVNICDLTLVNRRFTAVEDMSFARSSNEAANDIIKAGGGRVFIAFKSQEGEYLIGQSFYVNGVETAKLYDPKPVQYIYGTDSSLKREPYLGPFLQNGQVEKIGGYVLTEKGIKKSINGKVNTFLYKMKNMPPPQEEKKPLSAASIISSIAAFAALLTCAYKCFPRRFTL